MYAEFYGLRKLPFQLTPDPFFFYESAEHRKAMAHLTYGLHNGEGFIIITGEIGAGKTTLVDSLLSEIDPARFVAAKIVTSQLGGDDLLRLVCSAFGLDHTGLSKASVLNHLHQFITHQFGTGRRPLLIVDEAQNLSAGALEELRMLSNIVVGAAPALQSFLLGQPQLRQILGSPSLEQLRQRIAAAYHLGPLNAPDTQAYIEHRLRRAGWTDDPELSNDSFAAIYAHTGGVPRRINNLCSRLLLLGMLEESHRISAATVEEVAADFHAELSSVTISRPGEGGAGTYQQHTSLQTLLGSLDRLDGHGAGYIGTHDPQSTLQALFRRLDRLDDVTAAHDHAIRRIIEIISRSKNDCA
jgi:general secretion pathway protein A